MNASEKLQKIVDSGMTQGAIADRTGITQATISRILNNKHQDIRASTSEAITELYLSVVKCEVAA